MSSSVSSSTAVTVSTAVVFSGTLAVDELVNLGSALGSVAPVEPVPSVDQPLDPSGFFARIWTSYAVFALRLGIVTSNALIVVFVTSVQLPCGEFVRYR